MDLVCYSHLRWDFVYQRPQHIVTRLANLFRVFYIEEPSFHEGADGLLIKYPVKNIVIVTPSLNLDNENIDYRIQYLLTDFFTLSRVKSPVNWYYTPMALKYTPFFKPSLIVYDCMDELSAFAFAPQELKKFEHELLSKVDLVFTGGKSIYNHKKSLHHSVYLFASSIDKSHFECAREPIQDPSDQENIAFPRFGFFGVIDERFDIELIREVAQLKPDWQFVFVGPIVKIDPATLPSVKNVHYVGSKKYEELPSYISNWDIALIPFALNDSTRFISPTKTPEYLAAGKRIISTAIKDVIDPYQSLGLVEIINNADDFIEAGERLLTSKNEAWLVDVDKYLENISWDQTCHEMLELIEGRIANKEISIRNKVNHL